MDMTGIILAGGKGHRMGGKNKAFLTVGGKPLIDRILEVYRDLFQEILIVTNSPLDYLFYDCRIVTDMIKEKGSLGGIYSGLSFSSHEHCFVAACDMPFLDRTFIRFMMDRAQAHDIVVPRSPDGFQPLHAVYSRQLIPAMERMIGEDRLKIALLFKKGKTLTISPEAIASFDPGGRMFMNINSDEDLTGLHST